MGFSHVQGVSQTIGSGTGLTFVLASNPTAGDIVCVGIVTDTVVSGMTVQDTNGNSYTVTPQSPFVQGTRQIWLAYLLRAPSNASKSIVLSWTTTAGVDVWADEFSSDGSGFVSFDKDAGASNTVPGTTINTPIITPVSSRELLYATGTSLGGQMTAPAAGATLGVWTGSAGAPQFSDMSEYDLSANSPTAVNFTIVSNGWVAMAMAFFVAPEIIAVTSSSEDQWLGGDQY